MCDARVRARRGLPPARRARIGRWVRQAGSFMPFGACIVDPTPEFPVSWNSFGLWRALRSRIRWLGEGSRSATC
jgi:hypothetical protein